MLKVPYCDLTNDSSVHLDYRIPSDELGELRCSDLEVPLFCPNTFLEVISLYLVDILAEQWMFLAVGNIDEDTVTLLSDMCREIVEMTCSMVLEDVQPQVRSWILGKIPAEDANDSTNSLVSMDGDEAPQAERNYRTVTEEDIQASLGNSLQCCLQEVLEVQEDTSENSNRLMELVAGETARRVNHALLGTLSMFSQSSEDSLVGERPESQTKNMVYHVAKILACGIRYSSVSSEDESLATLLSESSISGEETIVERLSTGAIKDSRSEGQSSDISSYVHSVSPISIKKELQQGTKTFLAVFLGKLLDHITASTNSSVLELDFDGSLRKLRRIVVETSFFLPHTVGDLHCAVFDKLCLEFGSTELLLAAILSKDAAFEEAVAQELWLQLQKATESSPSLAREESSIFRRKTIKVGPPENGSTPTGPETECKTIIRMFSAAAQFVWKTFTSCQRSGSQDDLISQVPYRNPHPKIMSLEELLQSS